MHPQLQGLPLAAQRLAPILTTLELPEETLADCARCVMLPHDGQAPQSWHFNPVTTCCTYHPELPNYLVGRALLAGGEGAARVRKRLHEPAGRTELGLGPSAAYRSHYKRDPPSTFGKDPALVCPFRRDDALSCSIWANRNAVCRTWFCRHTTGLRSAKLWRAVRDVLGHVESLLAEHCVFTGSPPPEEGSATQWEDWYRYCADIVDSLPVDAHDRLASERLGLLGKQLDQALIDAHDERIDDVLIPSIADLQPVDQGMRVTGYSHYDAVTIPHSLFEFLSRLDGERTWMQAAEQASAQAGYEHDPTLFRRLVDRRIVRAPTDNDDPASPSAPDMQSLIQHP